MLPLSTISYYFGASPKWTTIIINECDNLNLPVAKDILTLGCKLYIHMIPFCRKLWLNIIVICFKSNDIQSCVKQNQKACFCWISLFIKKCIFEYCLHHVKKKKADLFTYFVAKTKRCPQVRVRLNSRKPIILLWKILFTSCRVFNKTMNTVCHSKTDPSWKIHEFRQLKRSALGDVIYVLIGKRKCPCNMEH